MAEASWRKMARLWLPTGPILGEDLDLEVFADSSGMQVKVRTGKGWIRGHYYETDAQLTKSIAASDPTNPRDDRVVLRADFVNNLCEIAVLTGTAAPSPSPPALTQSTSKWEVSLAKVRVDAAASTIAAGKVTDERSLVRLPGTFVGARLKAAAVNSVGNAAWHIGLTLGTTDFDTHSIAATANRLTIPAGLGGKRWLIGSYIRWAANGTGDRGIQILKNDVDTTNIGGRELVRASTGVETTLTTHIVDTPVAGDYFELSGYQSSGGNLDASNGALWAFLLD